MPARSPAVAVMSTNAKPGLLRRGRLPLDQLHWPLGRPERLMGADATLASLDPDDHLVSVPQRLVMSRPNRGTRARVSVVMMEPHAVHAARERRIARMARRYHRILSSNAALLDRVPNGIFFPFGSTWVPDWAERDMTKSAMCSLIASAKRSQVGHVLRHCLADRVRREGLDVDVMGGGYAPFAIKADGLAPYRYSLVIENVRETNYFTEKLIDAILCRTVPIYWGCPNVGDFFDTSGMIVCENEEELHAALLSMSVADYAARLPGLLAAQPMAEAYSDVWLRAAQAVLEDRPVPPAHHRPSTPPLIR